MVYKVFVFRLVVAVYVVEQVVKAVASAVDARAKVTACGQGEADGAQERTDSRCEEEEDEAGRQQRRSPPDRCSVAREQPEVLRHAGRAAAREIGVRKRRRRLASLSGRSARAGAARADAGTGEGVLRKRVGYGQLAFEGQKLLLFFARLNKAMARIGES